MKTLLIFLFTITISTVSISQNEIDTKLSSSISNIKESNSNYRLFPTDNMWTFIKLDTRNGKMWQVQFSIEDDNRFETILSSVNLAYNGVETSNRFTLYPTQNSYTFLLLDQSGGRTWQAQWAIEPELRGIVPIN